MLYMAMGTIQLRSRLSWRFLKQLLRRANCLLKRLMEALLTMVLLVSAASGQLEVKPQIAASYLTPNVRIQLPSCPLETSITGRGTIKSPNYPNPYFDNANCRWNLYAAAGGFVLLTFEDFDLENYFDFLTVYGDGIFIARYTGRSLPPVLTLGRNASLVFTSDVSIVKKGFSIVFSSIAGNCGSPLSGAGAITSPGYPREYSNNLVCVWGVVAEAGKTIVLRFESFNIENNYDTLECFNGNTLAARYTGSTIPQVLNMGTAGRIVFKSDFSVTASGFRIFFSSAVLPCGGALLGSAVITSPNYPALYPNNAECIWTISAPTSTVRLEFTAFDLEGPSYDIVKIYNGQSLTSTFSGSSLPAAFYSGSVSTIVFKSDYSVQHTGFRLVVTAGAIIL